MGRQVFTIQDNDDPGKKFAQRQAKELYGVAASVKVIDLSHVWPDISGYGDATDLIEHWDKLGPGPFRHFMLPSSSCFLTTEDSVRMKLKKKLRTAAANERSILTPGFWPTKRGCSET